MLKKVIGLMSGTSMDGIDAAYLKTDGKRKVELGESITLPFNQNLRQKLTKALSSNFELKALEKQLTEAHVDAITHLKNKMSTVGDDIDLIGFHGHTILHLGGRCADSSDGEADGKQIRCSPQCHTPLSAHDGSQRGPI